MSLPPQYTPPKGAFIGPPNFCAQVDVPKAFPPPALLDTCGRIDAAIDNMEGILEGHFKAIAPVLMKFTESQSCEAQKIKPEQLCSDATDNLLRILHRIDAVANRISKFTSHLDI